MLGIGIGVDTNSYLGKHCRFVTLVFINLRIHNLHNVHWRQGKCHLFSANYFMGWVMVLNPSRYRCLGKELWNRLLIAETWMLVSADRQSVIAKYIPEIETKTVLWACSWLSSILDRFLCGEHWRFCWSEIRHIKERSQKKSRFSKKKLTGISKSPCCRVTRKAVCQDVSTCINCRWSRKSSARTHPHEYPRPKRGFQDCAGVKPAELTTECLIWASTPKYLYMLMP